MPDHATPFTPDHRGYLEWLAESEIFRLTDQGRESIRAVLARVDLLEDLIENKLAWDREPGYPPVLVLQERYDRLKDQVDRLKAELVRWKDLATAELRRTQGAEADRDALFDLNVTIRDRAVLERICRADLVRVLEARGLRKGGDWPRGVGEIWVKSGIVGTTEILVPSDHLADRMARVADAISDLARAEGIGPLRVLAELLAGRDEAAGTGPGDE